MSGGGSLYLWSCFAPAIHMDVEYFSQSSSSFDGFVYLRFAQVDVARSGFATVCASCSAYECAHTYDCRSYLPHAEEDQRLTVMILDGQLIEFEVGANLTSLSGAGAAGGAAAGGGSHCSVTCIYAAPIVDKDAQWQGHGDVFGKGSDVARQRGPLAWALSSDYAPDPKYIGGELVGMQNLGFFDFDVKAKDRAVDEATASKLEQSCDGNQVASSGTWWKSCESDGFVDCGYDHAGKCCCPVGFRVTDGPDCTKCDKAVAELKAMRSKPSLYLMDPADGRFNFYLMLICALCMLPFPWLVAARLAWPKAWASSRQSFKDWYHRYLRTEYEFQPPRPASYTVQGSITVLASKLSGESKSLGGFAGNSRLGELRQAVAQEFAMDFPQVGLVLQAMALDRDDDFKCFAELGIEDQQEISVILSTEAEPETPLRDQLAGTYEDNVLAFLNRDSNVYKALHCQHTTQAVVATTALGSNYATGWICDGCTTKFPLNSTMQRCNTCRIDFCQRCVDLRGS